MVKIRFFIGMLIIIGIILVIPVVTYAASNKTKDIDIVYFYISVCKSCDEANIRNKEIQDILKDQNRSANIKMYNIEESSNYELMIKYIDYYKVKKVHQGAPIIFVGEKYIYGSDAIQRELLDVLTDNELKDTPIFNVDATSRLKILDSFKKYKGVNVFITGLINGFNPCSLSMLLFFISLLIARGKKILSFGFAFCIGKLMMYIFLGTSLYSVISKINTPFYDFIMKVITAAFCMVIVVLSLSDYIASKNERYDKIKVQLPAFLRRINHIWIKKINEVNSTNLLICMSFILGVGVSVGEFLCSGQLYLATILYIVRSGSSLVSQALIYFVIYSIAIVIPLIIIILTINKGMEVFEVSEVLRQKLPMIKIVNAIIFTLIGIIVIFFI